MFQFESGTPFCEPSSGLDLRFYYCGTRDCDQGRLKGPVVWDHYRLHYLQSGRGLLTVGGRSFTLESGQCFLVPAHTSTSYQAEGGVWNYHWVAFQGLNAASYLRRAGLTEEHPVVTVAHAQPLVACFERMYAASQNQRSGDVRMQAELLQLLALLMDSCPSLVGTTRKAAPPSYVTKAVEWFETNYSRSISIAETARYIGIHDKYFSRLFREETGMSPQAFLIQLRLNKAQLLLRNPRLPVAEVARSVGYDDPLLFSKMFKKVTGVSPVGYKHNLTQREHSGSIHGTLFHSTKQGDPP